MSRLATCAVFAKLTHACVCARRASIWAPRRYLPQSCRCVSKLNDKLDLKTPHNHGQAASGERESLQILRRTEADRRYDQTCEHSGGAQALRMGLFIDPCEGSDHTLLLPMWIKFAIDDGDQ